MSNDLGGFIGMYPVRKVIRNRLIPIGKTLEHIEEKGLIVQDREREQDYKAVKELANSCYANFIEDILTSDAADLDWNDLADATMKYKLASSDSKREALKVLDAEKEKKRIEIRALFVSRREFKSLFNSDLITKVLPEYYQEDEEALQCIAQFKGFTTYFTGFYQNRENVFSSEEQATAIPFRIVEVNFGKFHENLLQVERIRRVYPDVLVEIEKELKEVLGDEKVEDYFSVEGFNRVLAQSGIDVYNQILGGVSFKDKKIKGINELLNLAYQKSDKNEKSQKYKLQPLHKQILTKADSGSFIYDSFSDDEEVYLALVEVNNEISKKNETLGNISILEKFVQLVDCFDSYSQQKIYVNNQRLSNLSVVCFDDWSIIPTAFQRCADNKIGPVKGLTQAQIKSWLNKKYYSLDEVQEVVELSGSTVRLEEVGARASELLASIKQLQSDVLGLKEKCVFGEKNLLKDEGTVNLIKGYLDALQDYLHLAKIFEASSDEDRSLEFYADFDEVIAGLSYVVPLYNQVRNYVTQKPYSQEKFKLNFENPTLCGGWDLNKERDNTAALLRRNGKYYLAILNVSYRKALQEAPEAQSSEVYQKMVYKLLPGPNKMLPKVFFAKSNVDYFAPSDEVMRVYKEGSFKKGENFSKKDCHLLIDYYKECIDRHEDWSKFDFNFSNTDSYQDISEFFSEVRQQGYKVHFVDIDEVYINQLVDEGKIYLFQIYNKDFSPHSKGNKNMHTLYLLNAFSEENLEDVVIKLDGEAEIFYRPASIDEPIIHKEGTPLVNRTYTATNKDTGEVIRERIQEEAYKELIDYAHKRLSKDQLGTEAHTLLENEQVVIKEAKYDIIKDRRYTQPQFSFHAPLTLNFKAENIFGFNSKVLDYLDRNKKINIIGVDRGERHLLYYSLIDQNGTILEQNTLNTINGINYREKLHQKELERDAARKDWKSINKIADIKEGYLSLVVYELAKMMVEKNAILVMEDLNFGFKRGRFKIEKQVYQKFEKQLIDKLGYFAQKPNVKKVDENGGVLRGYQLAAPFTSFEKLGKQSGFVFYVPAWNTSHIDPTTGFCSLFKWSQESVDPKAFFKKMDSIKYNPSKGYFEFSFNYANYKTVCTGKKMQWKVCSHGETRWVTKIEKKNGKRVFSVVERNVTKELKALFADAEIPYENGQDIRETLLAVSSAKFFKELMNLFKILVQLRYSTSANSEDPKDFIISPVMNDEGSFFISEEGEGSLPENADANGSYNIALKGLQLITEQIEVNSRNGLRQISYPKKPNEEWLRFIQDRSWAKH